MVEGGGGGRRVSLLFCSAAIGGVWHEYSSLLNNTSSAACPALRTARDDYGREARTLEFSYCLVVADLVVFLVKDEKQKANESLSHTPHIHTRIY